MRKVLLVFLFWFILICSSWAMDDPSVYGDGVSVTFNDIRNTLPHLYKNTPVIYVNTKSGTKSYSFNVEMYIDKGFLVYGDPASCVDLGYSNSFKQTPHGYFCSGGGIRGEYRYLGLSINGTVYTNIAFPEDTVPGEHVYRIVKYSSLPDYLKERYGIPKEGNAYFEGIRHLVDSPDSPAWNFVHTYYDGRTVTVYQKFKESMLVVEGQELPSLFEYARITGWGSGGGSLVLYYQSLNDGSVYRYATFTGSINPSWEKVFHGIECEVDFANSIYKIEKDEDSVVVGYRVRGTFRDNYTGLSELMKKFTYTREDVVFYRLYSDGVSRSLYNVVKEGDKVVFSTSDMFLTFRRQDLHVGYNIVEIVGEAKVGFEGCVFSSSHSSYAVIYVEPETTPSPTPDKTPEPTQSVLPSETPFPYVKRRW